MLRLVAPRTPNLALVKLREDAGLSQQELADELNDLAAREFGKHPQITKKTVGRWERGEVDWPHPLHRRLLATYFHVAVDELGFHRPKRLATTPVSSSDELLTLVATPGSIDPRVEQDQQQWRQVRAALAQRRRELAHLAEHLYPDRSIPELRGTGVITTAAWIPPHPIPINDLTIDLDTTAPPPQVTGEEPASAPLRPLASVEQRYLRYHHAVRDLAAPRLFENRLCYRLLALDWTTRHARFGLMGFFDSIDTNEALAHETALHHLTRDQHGALLTSAPSWRRLAFRKQLGDPVDLARRPLMGAIGTLTIRAGHSPSIVLHHRDGDRVAGGGAMTHLMPAGIFQPSSVLPDALTADFSIWRNIQREYAEELLGLAEYDGNGRPIDYAHPFFATTDHGLADGRIRVWYLGLTLDALTLCGDILTVAVIDPDLYDHLFADAVTANTEGSIPARRISFDEHTLNHLHHNASLSPGAAAALHYTWHHRTTLLDAP